MGLIDDNKRREEAAKRALGIDEDYERRIFAAIHPNTRSEDEEYDDDDEYEDYDEDDECEEDCDEEEDEDEDDEMSATGKICGAIIGAKILRRGEEMGLINLDDL